MSKESVVDPDEQIVSVSRRLEEGGPLVSGFVIRDRMLGHERTKSSLDAYDAWSRIKEEAEIFPTTAKAEAAMRKMWKHRRESTYW